MADVALWYCLAILQRRRTLPRPLLLRTEYITSQYLRNLLTITKIALYLEQFVPFASNIIHTSSHFHVYWKITEKKSGPAGFRVYNWYACLPCCHELFPYLFLFKIGGETTSKQERDLHRFVTDILLHAPLEAIVLRPISRESTGAPHKAASLEYIVDPICRLPTSPQH